MEEPLSEYEKYLEADLQNENLLLCKNLSSLAIFGLWPFQSKGFLNNRRLRKLHFLYGLVLYCVFFVFLISEYMELANVWGDLEDMTTNMSVSCLYTVGVMKIYAFFGHRKKLKKLISGISTVETNIMRTQRRQVKAALCAYVCRARQVTYFFWTLTGCTITVFFVIPPIEYRFSSTYHKKMENGTDFWTYERPMIFSSWFPFDKYAHPYYLVAYIYQVMMGSVGAAYQAIWDTFIVTMMIHSIGQLQILQLNLENITNIDRGKPSHWDTVKDSVGGKQNSFGADEFSRSRDASRVAHNRLVDCVNHHRYILRFSHDLNSITSPVMMLYFMVCSLMLCAIGFQASLYGFSIRLCFMVEYLLAMMVQLFLFYWHGNEVIHESSKLLMATYNCIWYNENNRFKKSLWILGVGVQMPIKYSVGPFYSMSMPTFLAILKASYSYFTLLRTVEEDAGN